MPEDKNPQPQQNENVEGNEENVNDRFESDTQRIIHRHLQDEDDIITDNDIASIRVGMIPPKFDKATEARFEGEEARQESEEELTNGAEDMDANENLNDTQTTPWDLIDPSK